MPTNKNSELIQLKKLDMKVKNTEKPTVSVRKQQEIELIRESALLVSKTLGMIAGEIKVGVTTLHLDKLAEEFIRDNGAIPGFLGMYDFPNTLCISPNSQVV